MEEISTYSISKLQKALELSANRKDYFFVSIGKEPLYTDEPFRTETFTVMLLKEGEMNLNAGLTTHLIKAPALVTVAPTVTRSFKRCRLKPAMELIFFTESFLLEQQPNIFFLSKFPFFEDNDTHAVSLDAETYTKIEGIFGQIANCMVINSVHERAILQHLIFILIYEIDAFHKKLQALPVKTDSINPLFQKFRNLLTKEFLRHRSVNYYAEALHVTPKYLSEVVKRNTGKTAGEWIDKAVLLEAKVLLQNKSLNIAQISESLNFSDQSFFGKYFKNLQGMSPLDYRKSLK